MIDRLHTGLPKAHVQPRFCLQFSKRVRTSSRVRASTDLRRFIVIPPRRSNRRKNDISNHDRQTSYRLAESSLCILTAALFLRIWPKGTVTGRGRWWSSPMRISCGPDPSRWGRRHKAAAQRGSELERSRRRFASRACRSHRPEWTAPLDRETPYGKACHQGLAGRLRYRRDLRGTSTARRPSTNTDPSKRSLAVAHRLGSEPRSDETRDPARSSATGRRQSAPGSRTIVTLLMQADFRVVDNQIAASQNQAQLAAPERFGARAVIETKGPNPTTLTGFRGVPGLFPSAQQQGMQGKFDDAAKIKITIGRKP